MSEVKISADLRTEFGKGGARRTRRAGKVPAVLYGHGEKPRHLALPARELAAAIRHGGMTQVFNVEISDGSTALALPRALQRDPLKDTFTHVDLVIVKRGEKVTVDVPVRLVGEAARETLVITENDRISVVAEALHLPDHVDVSIDGLQPGSRVTAGEVTLPRGAELAADPDQVLVMITAAPTAEQMEAELGEAAEAPAEAEGEAEAPEEASAQPPAES